MAENYADVAHRQYVEDLQEVADRIRRIADEVEREGKVRATILSIPPHAYAASRAVHAVIWGIANTSLDGLVTAAAQADRAAEAAASDGVQ